MYEAQYSLIGALLVYPQLFDSLHIDKGALYSRIKYHIFRNAENVCRRTYNNI